MEACLGFHISCAATCRTSRTQSCHPMSPALNNDKTTRCHKKQNLFEISHFFTSVALEKVKMTGCLGISPNARASSTGRSVLGSGHFQQQDRMRMLSQFKEGVQIRGMGSKSTSRYGPPGVHISLVDLDRGVHIN